MWFNSYQRAKSYHDHVADLSLLIVFNKWVWRKHSSCMAAVSPCLEMLGLISQRAQPLFYCLGYKNNSRRDLKWGRRQVSMRLGCRGLHICYKGDYNTKYFCKKIYIRQKFPKFGLFSETWKHEGGIASTRLSQRSGESIYAYAQTARQAMIGLFLESFDGGDFFVLF